MTAPINPDDGEVPDDLPIPPASERVGTPGQDLALDMAVMTRLIRLRVAGMTYDQLAVEGGYADASGARSAILRALRRHEAEAVNDLRTLEDARIDSVVRTATEIQGDRGMSPIVRLRAADTLLRAGKQRRDLHGLDAPKQIIISAGVASDLERALDDLEDAVRTVVGEAWETDPAETVEARTDDPPTALEA